MSGVLPRCTRSRIPRRCILRRGRTPAVRTKLAIGADLAVRERDVGSVFRAVVADSACGDQDGFRGEIAETGLPFVMALKPSRGTSACGLDAHAHPRRCTLRPGLGRVRRSPATGRR